MNTDKNDEPGLAKAEEPAPTFYSEQELAHRILEAAFAVHNTLGAGFLEKVYENALAMEIRSQGLLCERQCFLKVRYKNAIVGDYQADLAVEQRVLVELKACTAIDATREAQIMNYLRASGLRVALLLNFGKPKLQYRRFVA